MYVISLFYFIVRFVLVSFYKYSGYFVTVIAITIINIRIYLITVLSKQGTCRTTCG